MAKNVLVSIICADRVGLVSAISASLFDLGGNLGDTSFAVLGAGAEFTSICEMPDEIAIEEIEGILAAQPELQGAKVVVAPFDLGFLHGPKGDISHFIEITGGDRPGLIGRLSEVFVQFDANIVRMTSEKTPAGDDFFYAIRIAAQIPPERVEACLATVMNTAGEMKLSATWQTV